MGVERFLTFGRLDAERGSIRKVGPTLFVVLEVGEHDLIQNLLVYRRVENRAQRFDAAVEVARHHVGRGDVNRSLRMRQPMAIAEAIDTSVLEKTPHDRLGANVIR